MCRQQFITSGSANAADDSIIKLVRETSIAAACRVVETSAWTEYLRTRSEYQDKRKKLIALHLSKEEPSFPELSRSYIPSRRFLVTVLLWDYQRNRVHLRRELKQVTSQMSLSCDHQRGVIKKTRSKEILGQGGQTLTVAGDFNLCLSVVAVPSTSDEWLEDLFSELKHRHNNRLPPRIYLDKDCCGGIPGVKSTPSATWKKYFSKIVLDGMHLIMRIGREIPAENPRRQAFLRDISRSIYQSHPKDVENVLRAKRLVGDTTPISRVDRCRFIRRVIGDGVETAERVKHVIASYQKADAVALENAQRTGQPISYSKAEATTPIITKRLLKVAQRQIIHLRNRCCEDNLDDPPYRKIGSINYKNGPVELSEYRSLRGDMTRTVIQRSWCSGTSRVESIHSVMAKAFGPMNALAATVYDCRLSWLISSYNRRRQLALNMKVPPVSVTPRDIELFIASGALDPNKFPDYTLASPDCASLPLIGFEYGRLCNNQASASCLEEELSEDQVGKDDLAEVLALESSWEASCSAEGGGSSEKENDEGDAILMDTFEKAESIGSWSSFEDQVLNVEEGVRHQKVDSTPEDTSRAPSDEDLFGSVSHIKTPRNVAKKRSLTHSPTAVAPDFNSEMEQVWISILAEVSTTSKGEKLTKKCLTQYLLRKHELLSRSAGSQELPPALLDVSYAHADNWIKQQLKFQSLPARESMFGSEVATEFISLDRNLKNLSLANQKAFAKPCKEASLEVKPGQFDAGPAGVTLEDRVLETRRKADAKVAAVAEPGQKRKSKKRLCPYCHLPLQAGLVA